MVVVDQNETTNVMLIYEQSRSIIHQSVDVNLELIEVFLFFGETDLPVQILFTFLPRTLQ